MIALVVVARRNGALSVWVRNRPSRGSVGLKVGLLMTTGNGKASVPRSGKSQNNRGTSASSGRIRTPSAVCSTGIAIVVKPLLSTAIVEVSGSATSFGVGCGHRKELHLAVYPFLVGLLQAHRWFGYSTLSSSRTNASV